MPTKAYDSDTSMTQKLVRTSRAVWYEAAMLLDLYDHLRENPKEMRFLRNAHLEAFLIHARQLYDFFYDHGYDEDVTASMYFANPNDWVAVRKQAVGSLEVGDWRTRINKEVVHISEKRSTREPVIERHEVDAIARGLDALQNTFCEHVEQGYLDRHWYGCDRPSIGYGFPTDESIDKSEDAANSTDTTEL